MKIALLHSNSTLRKYNYNTYNTLAPESETFSQGPCISFIDFVLKIAAKILSISDDTSTSFPHISKPKDLLLKVPPLFLPPLTGIMSLSSFYALHGLVAFAMASERQLMMSSRKRK